MYSFNCNTIRLQNIRYFLRQNNKTAVSFVAGRNSILFASQPATSVSEFYYPITKYNSIKLQPTGVQKSIPGGFEFTRFSACATAAIFRVQSSASIYYDICRNFGFFSILSISITTVHRVVEKKKKEKGKMNGPLFAGRQSDAEWKLIYICVRKR